MGMNTNVNLIRVSIISMTAALAVWGGALAAFGQDASPTPTPTETAAPAPAAAPPKLYYLEVDPNDLQAISQALMELPKKIADPLVLKLNAQLKVQDDIAAKAKPNSAGALVDAKKPKNK